MCSHQEHVMDIDTRFKFKLNKFSSWLIHTMILFFFCAHNSEIHVSLFFNINKNHFYVASFALISTT